MVRRPLCVSTEAKGKAASDKTEEVGRKAPRGYFSSHRGYTTELMSSHDSTKGRVQAREIVQWVSFLPAYG